MKRSEGFARGNGVSNYSDDWITPPWIISAFNSLSRGKMFFTLDPCISMTQPWETAEHGYNKVIDGLSQRWTNERIWLNPPYDKTLEIWIKRLLQYKNGVTLIFARLETQLWQDFIFPNSSGILFPKHRIAFARPNGVIGATAGAPSAFVSFGVECRDALYTLASNGLIAGAYFDSPRVTVSQIQNLQSAFSFTNERMEV